MHPGILENEQRQINNHQKYSLLFTEKDVEGIGHITVSNNNSV
jgi:hypothetical protein